MDTFTRICKKCLLREMSEADTYKTMYEYIANLNPDDKPRIRNTKPACPSAKPATTCSPVYAASAAAM